MKKRDGTLTDAQLRAELERCLYCESKPCRQACPAHCSPADFIMAARVGEKSDYRRAAALITGANPLGWLCGAVCPDYFCVKACSRATFDHPINIPAVQATLIKKANEDRMPVFKPLSPNGKSVAVVGAGPGGLSAAGVLAQLGYTVTVFEKSKAPGGAVKLIPGFRLDNKVTSKDVAFVKALGVIDFKFRNEVSEPARLLESHGAVIVSAGADDPAHLNVLGAEAATSWQEYLSDPSAFVVAGRKVAVLGGGAVAADCATTAKRRGAALVELIYRRKQQNMPLTSYERNLLLEHSIEISSCVRVLEIVGSRKYVKGLWLAKLTLPPGKSALPENFVINRKEPQFFREFDLVISAVGGRSRLPIKRAKGVFYAGDMVLGSGTVVEAVATGKNAALEADCFIRGTKAPRITARAKSKVLLAGANQLPVALGADFFGRRILSPFLLSAAPHTDGYAQMHAAYQRGWAGGVIKTAFDNVPIHIPGEHTTVLGPCTYGNCDNVSGHPLNRVCEEVERLVGQFPDRLTLASTGGPVTGRDNQDKAVWQGNTRKLEKSGVMGIEYSLSCPQGGDGTNGDLVSQNAELTAKIIDWVLETGDGNVPKLFKLTAAVTAIQPILAKVKEVFEKHPGEKAGVTLANSFPALTFRKTGTRRWEEGVVVGMSGEGVLPISNLTLAKASALELEISGNGGAMNYKAAANFLALGAKTVQFCSIVMKYGLGIVDELHSGLSWLMEERGFASVTDLVGSALPNAITEFAALSAEKQIPEVVRELCQHCGNCAHCPYLAVSLDAQGVPAFNPADCIGCSLCAQNCFAGAIFMRKRTPSEAAKLQES